jgi:hypothetical protein
MPCLLPELTPGRHRFTHLDEAVRKVSIAHGSVITLRPTSRLCKTRRSSKLSGAWRSPEDANFNVISICDVKDKLW